MTYESALYNWLDDNDNQADDIREDEKDAAAEASAEAWRDERAMEFKELMQAQKDNRIDD